MWDRYIAPASLPEALHVLAQYGEECRLIAGGTDLILELERGLRRQRVLVDLGRLPGFDCIEIKSGTLHLGPLVTHSQVLASGAVAAAFPLARACWLVGAPQIRNRGTVAGNVVTASPANDTITPLWAMDARITLASGARGERTLSFDEFFLGVRRTALAPDEMVVGIHVPTLGGGERGTFLKLGLRQAQAVSLVNVAAVLDLAPESGVIRRARIALGAVAPTILRAGVAEAFLAGKLPSDDVIAQAATLAAEAARPISDVRASAEYRRDMVRVLTVRALQQLRDGSERAGWPAQPVLLANNGARRAWTPPVSGDPEGIPMILNGKPAVLRNAHGKTLLRALREDAGLIGAKEGCAEGECGACTVWLDGMAVMSCLVPVERAAGCEVVTVEGLAPATGGLDPLQQAFVDQAAVQCGYCTPGLLMSAGMLLQEVQQPTQAQVKEALTGNLCRCTGYYKILQAVEQAAAAGRPGHGLHGADPRQASDGQ